MAYKIVLTFHIVPFAGGYWELAIITPDGLAAATLSVSLFPLIDLLCVLGESVDEVLEVSSLGGNYDQVNC